MKKTILILCVAGLILTSCGGLESDAKKLANIDCELKNLTNPNPNKVMELGNKYDKLKKEFELKYKNEYQKFDKLYREALKECD